MNILLIGGTGTISTAVTELALERGHTVYLLNRGERKNSFAGKTRDLIADKNDRAAMQKVLGDIHFDVVANFITYTQEEVERDVALFHGRTNQYIFISSASVYQKPPNHYVITESTPLCNPYWQYSRNKIAAEDTGVRAYREKGFPITIVRPSYTYSKTWVPGLFDLRFQHFERIKKGKPLPVHGDGQSLWQMTFNEDFAKGFVGLFGNPRALGEAFHITSDEVLTWDQIMQTMARAMGKQVELVHIPVEFVKRASPPHYDGLKGDKMYSVVLDNSKIKSVVPDFRATTSFYDGMRKCIAYWTEHPEVSAANAAADENVDKMIASWQSTLSNFH